VTRAEKQWWRKHGDELVDTMASPDGPDLVVLLHDKTSYGVYGDHGGATESVQRVPMVFWSPSLSPGDDSGREFETVDVLPTILRAMDLPLVAPVDGDAHRLDRGHGHH
jgi:arylsulfatase A-like enzyme